MWSIRPLKEGVFPVFLRTTIKVKDLDFGEQEKDVKIYENKIKVSSKFSTKVKKFFGTHWKWIAGWSGAIIAFFFTPETVKEWLWNVWERFCILIKRFIKK
jgi:hypothetical protein